MLDIISNQRQPKLLVGDPHQQIYSFRGAVNAMSIVQAAHTFYLTQVRGLSEGLPDIYVRSILCMLHT